MSLAALPPAAVQALTDPAWVAYQAWQNPRVFATQGKAAWNGFANGFRIAAAASPSWSTITPAQQLEHIEACDVCIFCEAGRAWGRCTSCGDTKEALPPLGLSRCCGSPVAFGGEVA